MSTKPDGSDYATEAIRGVGRLAAVMAGAGIGGSLAILVRELFVASQVGTSPELDALLIAAVVPMMIANLLAGGTAAAIVPGHAAMTHSHGVHEADKLLGATMVWTTIICSLAAAAVIIASHFVVAIAGPGLDPKARELAITFVPWLAPLIVVSELNVLLVATFQIHNRMRPVAIAWFLGPFASLLVTVGLWGQAGLFALAMAMTIQHLVIIVFLALVALRWGFMPPLTARADRAEARRLVGHVIPLTISSSVLQLNLLADRAIATLIAPGGVSALRYAEGIVKLPLNAFGSALESTMYPALVRATHAERPGSLGETAMGALRFVTAIFVPLSVATAAMAPLIVELAYARGAFDAEASVLTTGALAGFAPLLFFTMISTILTGSHNAARRGVFLMSMGLLNAVLNAVFDVGFGFLFGVGGIALSTALTVGIVQFLKAWRLGSLEATFPLAEVLKVSAKALAASACVAVPIGLIAWNAPSGLGTVTVAAILVGLSTAGMLGYIAISRAMGLQEPWFLARKMWQVATRLIPGRR
jgi:putative peptidoglycan lipid II flippase